MDKCSAFVKEVAECLVSNLIHLKTKLWHGILLTMKVARKHEACEIPVLISNDKCEIKYVVQVLFRHQYLPDYR